jgi:hypothetical protein
MLTQLVLAACGLTALYLATCTKSQTARRWAPIVGLAGQPWWIAYAVGAQAWGLFVLSLVYSAVYVRGIWVQWRAARA